VEAAVLELALNAQRGSFYLHIDCTFASAWTVIFGPSGAGKSTLLRLIAGLDLSAQSRPRSARVVLDGRALTDSAHRVWLKPGHRQTSMVAQQSALFPHLSVAENIGYGLHSLNHFDRASRIGEMLDLVDAGPLLERRPRDLSGGEAQRIALARALAPYPRLLLLDEPFSALDGSASDALLVRLQHWTTAHHVQTVMATHDAADALAMGAEVMLLHEGRIGAQGPATEVLSTERKRLLDRLG
jgi:ABC-type sulfate/molybdate transport systems ATPase subunit